MANVEVGTTRLLSEKFLLGKNAKNTGIWKIGENWFHYNCRKTVSLKKNIWRKGTGKTRTNMFIH